MFDTVRLESETRRCSLVKALLIYKEGGKHIVTENGVSDGVITEGKLLDVEDLKALIGGMSGDGEIRPKTMIGREYRVLGFAHDAVLFEVLGTARKLKWSEVKGRKKSIIIPDMIFKSTRSGLYVWITVGGDIYEAPFYNVWKGGKVCLGGNKLPDIWDLGGWVEVFFGSPFTYTNGQKVKGMSLESYWEESYRISMMMQSPLIKSEKQKPEELL